MFTSIEIIQCVSLIGCANPAPFFRTWVLVSGNKLVYQSLVSGLVPSYYGSGLQIRIMFTVFCFPDQGFPGFRLFFSNLGFGFGK